MGTWLNNDGLFVRFGNDKAKVLGGGSYAHGGPNTVLEFDLTGTDVAATTTEIDANLNVGSGGIIAKVEIFVEAAFTSGGAATLDIGFNKKDGTALDAEGLVAALALTAIDAVGETTELTLGATGAGALVGTALSEIGVITANYGTAAYTAGASKVRIYVSYEG